MQSIEEQELKFKEESTRDYLLHKEKLKGLIKNCNFREYMYNILLMSGVLPSKMSLTVPLSANELFYKQGIESVGKNILNELMETDEEFLSILLNEKRNGIYD